MEPGVQITEGSVAVDDPASVEEAWLLSRLVPSRSCDVDASHAIAIATNATRVRNKKDVPRWAPRRLVCPRARALSRVVFLRTAAEIGLQEGSPRFEEAALERPFFDRLQRLLDLSDVRYADQDPGHAFVVQREP